MESGKIHFDRELKLNAFSRFYRTAPAPDETFKRTIDSDVQSELNKYTHSDAIRFAAKSWTWESNTGEELPRREDKGIQTFRFQTGIRAYYRVLADKGDSYVLIACHANLHGYHRGDLRFVEVNDTTETQGMGKSSIIGKLYPGDVVAIVELAKKKNVPLNPPGVFQVHPEFECFWEVRHMTILMRKQDREVNFAIIEDGTAVVEGFSRSMNVLDDSLSTPLEVNKIYFGYAFIPERVKMNFTEDFDRKYENLLTALYSKLPTYAHSSGTIFTYAPSEMQTRFFKIGRDAFCKHAYRLYGSQPNKVVETCVRMGAAAAQTIGNNRFDERSFPIQSVQQDDRIVSFAIPNPEKQPTEGRWSNNTRIVLSGTNRKICAIIETVVFENDVNFIRISARIPKDSSRNINFREDTWIVHQGKSPEIPRIDRGFLSRLEENSNGSRIIKTLYGGESINLDSSEIDLNSSFCFPSSPVIVLNEFQNDYVSKILANVPIVLGNSPFGCGKSMTIVTAAIEIHKQNGRFNGHGKQRQQLLVTQSNNAGVSLVEIARKIDSSQVKIKFLRYISENNWNVLPDSSRTDLDMPKLMRDMFVPWAIGTVERTTSLNFLTIGMKQAIVRKVAQEYLYPSQLVGEASRIYDTLNEYDKITEPSPRTLREAFFIFYEPDIIVSTADSLQGLLSCNLRLQISSIQIDEASQLPEHTLIYILQRFPHAGYGLVGDIKQLPPHCEKELKGLLKDYGIGNTMQRAINELMFLQSNLLYVYRCHPVTTELLSDMFYDGSLIPGVSEFDRNEFMRMRPDIWPNVRFPILVLNQKGEGYKVGTSVANEVEKNYVLRIVSMLTREVNGYRLKESDIGVISFYRAQTSLLTEAFRSTDVKCGTIDAFQGSEKEVIIVCCTNKKISPFMQLGNRLNVALSRSRQATILIGNVAGLREAKYWGTIVREAQENQCLIDDINQFGVNVGNYSNGNGKLPGNNESSYGNGSVRTKRKIHQRHQANYIVGNQQEFNPANIWIQERQPRKMNIENLFR
ncbi:hypothetical protein L3Y34_007625 [Caenorhabditis briggsae]|uniref:DNA2/NAM7 helicase-like C-terminal domain-containing protein n=1 Tax=Caenorhabditis briggsae TaxID=6238 RepID=A0AAE9A274_CAEBR|nr:hypothetical protein L3Y34_007625 [Caenorhabditis briggsae]